VNGHQIVLLDVYTVNGTPTIQVEVDGDVSTVSRGDSFGPSNQFEFVSASGSCATMRSTEESFTLCVTPQK
jgi:hypothetical protein